MDNADCWSFLSFGFGFSNWMVLSLLMINPFNFLNHFWHLINFMDNQKDKFVNTCGMWCGRSWFLSFIFSVLEQQAYSILVSAHLYKGLYMGSSFSFLTDFLLLLLLSLFQLLLLPALRGMVQQPTWTGFFSSTHLKWNRGHVLQEIYRRVDVGSADNLSLFKAFSFEV